MHPLATFLDGASLVADGSGACKGDVGTAVFVVDVVAEAAVRDGLATSWTGLECCGEAGCAARQVLTRR